MQRRILATLAAAAALAAATPARADGAARRLELAPIVGAYVPIMTGRDDFKDALLTGVQLSYDVHPNLALVGTFSWAASGAQRLGGAGLDLFQYDLGARGQYAFELGRATLRPFLGVGAGLRTIHFRDTQYVGGDDLVGYGSTGLEVGYRALVAGVTGRYELCNTPAPSIGVRTTRRDLQLFTSVGLRF